MFNEEILESLSYRELQVLAAQHRVPGNIKKHIMIKVILAARRGDDSEVTRVLNELQQTRKKRIKKIKKDVKTTMRSSTIHKTNCQENRYYAHQLKQTSFRCASNLQIVTKEEISNHDGEQQTISNYDDVHEYLLRAQRDYRYDTDNNNDQRARNSSIVDLRMNEQKSVINQALPLDLHRATNILLSPTYNHNIDNTDKMNYHHFLDPDDSLQTPLLLKKMLQAPVGTNLKEYAGPDGVYRVYSRNNYSQSNFFYDSDTITAKSDSNENDDIDNTTENLYCILNADKNSFIHIDQNLISDHNVQDFNSMNQNFSNNNDHYRTDYQLTDPQQNCQKWVQQSSVTLINNASEIGQDNPEILKSLYYSNENSFQERNNHVQTNQCQYQAFNNCSMMTNNNNNNGNSNYYCYNNDSRVESSNSSTQQIAYNHQNENNNASIVNNNMQNNHNHLYYNQQNSSNDTSGYNSQIYNVHDTGVFNNIYPSVDAISSQQFNHDIDSSVAFNNQTEINNVRSNNNEYYCSNIYPQSSQIGINVNHNETQTLPNNQFQQYMKNRESYEIGMNQNTSNGDLESYVPRWKQSAITSVIHKNLENLLNIRKYHQLDESKSNETSSVFCYSAPIITPKQLSANANVCTQQRRFVVENRKNSLLKINSNQVYSDAAQGRKMANVIEDLSSTSINQLDMDSSNVSSNDESFDHNHLNEIDSNTSLGDIWTLDSSNVSSNIHTKSFE